MELGLQQCEIVLKESMSKNPLGDYRTSLRGMRQAVT